VVFARWATRRRRGIYPAGYAIRRQKNCKGIEVLTAVIGGALAFLAAVLYVPFLRELFGFAYLHFIDIVICFMAEITSILWLEGLKIVNGKKNYKGV
jgi:hypothetical protein